ncbi:MAG: permease [Planctomycetota bacterium]
MKFSILKNLDIVFMGAIVAVLVAIALWVDGPGRVGEGMKEGGLLLYKIWPLLLLAAAAAGMLKILVPAKVVSSYMGAHSPMRGILIGWGVGAVLPGAPYVVLPLAAVLLQRGAAIGPAATMVLSATFMSVTRIPYELTFLGWQFSALRILACALLPPVAGLFVHGLNDLFGFYAAG